MKAYTTTPISLPIASKDQLPSEGVHFVWLGQFGFLFVIDGKLILADAYLSNYLEHNHGDLPYEHGRLVSSPLAQSIYPDVDMLVNSHMSFVVPPGCVEQAHACGIEDDRIHTISHEKEFSFEDCVRIEAFPAAHPVALFDVKKVWALSYRFHFNGHTLLFAGDTTVYAEWAAWVYSKPCDLFLLPINGRTEEKERNGIVGNMDFHEALIVSLAAKVPMLGTHFGMFAYNTVEIENLQREVEAFGIGGAVDFTRLGYLYSLR
jgi:L-ascorbate metabolism protein UlaG (beta-lactamase superfamily)